MRRRRALLLLAVPAFLLVALLCVLSLGKNPPGTFQILSSPTMPTIAAPKNPPP